MIGLIELFFGTSNHLLMVLLLSVTVFGYFIFLRGRPLLGIFCLSILVSYLATFLIIKPIMAHVSIVAAQYIMPLSPIGILFMALGAEKFYMKVPSTLNIPIFHSRIPLKIIIGGGLILSILTTSPLFQIYRSPNNFTNHTAFQETYSTIQYSEPKISEAFPRKWHLTAKTISSFYKQLADNPHTDKIIEYPMLVGSNFNPYYYYQQFHKKKVAVGFIRNIDIHKSASKGCVGGSFLIDFILSRLSDDQSKKIKFKKFN